MNSIPTTAVKDYQDVYLANFRRQEAEFAAGPSWLNVIRKAALDRFMELGFPSTRNEDWKYTSVAPIAEVAFRPAPKPLTAPKAETLAFSCFFELDCTRLVFVNGRLNRELSVVSSLSKEVKACSLAEALRDGTPALEEHLGKYASYQNEAFTALNTAFLSDGAFIEIPKGLVLEKPIYVLYVSTSGSHPAVSFPRNLILAGRESQATFIEGHVGIGEEAFFANAVTEIVAGENAVVEYGKVHQESGTSFHVATVQVEQARSSAVTTHSFAFGCALVRENLNIVLGGEGGDAQLNGLYVTAGRQHIDHHTKIDHAKAHCTSRELYKGVLDGRSAGVFNGRIVVRKDAQKTDSKQSNKNLLLSEDAVINTKPQLEIFADDVKCTHGATIGQVDQEAIFYLRSRGIGHEEARKLLTFAFANEIIERVKYAPLRDRLRDALFACLARKARKENA